ncbi:hypothetical protein Bca4012_064699 [Brassica carinata]
MRLRKKNTSKILSLREVLKELGDEFPEKLKISRYLRTTRNVRTEIKKGKIGDCGGSASREVPLGDLSDKELVKVNSEHEVDIIIIGINAEKMKRIMVGDGTKEAECLLHEGGDEHNEMEDDERLKQRNNAIEKLALTLEARMLKVEETLAKIRERKIEIKRAKNRVSA